MTNTVNYVSAIRDVREQLSADLRTAGLERVYTGWAPNSSIDNSIQIVPNPGQYLKYDSFGEGYTLHLDVLIVAKFYNDPAIAWNWLDQTAVKVLASTIEWDVTTVDSPALIAGTENLSVTIHLSRNVTLKSG